MENFAMKEIMGENNGNKTLWYIWTKLLQDRNISTNDTGGNDRYSIEFITHKFGTLERVD